ncbi:TIGR02642 family protein [Pectobacterium versatile]|uniref:TIGR02642 family protein n=1 Tax=Pectobacterium versatile TaxID=2488639 RepID=UPI001CCFF03F|nr:TIGR02642 family protein [Pectobacterium versatile]
MTIAIEQLIKMHDPRCMSIESLNVGRGRAILSKEQILGAFATAQRKNPVGYDLLMAKYRHDSDARFRIMGAIYAWEGYATYQHLEHSDIACHLAVNMVLERSLPAQADQIARLLRRYGTRSSQTRKNTDSLNADIKRLEKKRCRDKVSDADYFYIGCEIEQLRVRIKAERQALYDWSEQEARQRNTCPRCNGTGKTLRPAIAVCNECGGNGRITATFEHLRQSLMDISGAMIPRGEWPQYLDLIKRCMNWLYVEESQAVSALSTKIHDEMEA